MDDYDRDDDEKGDHDTEGMNRRDKELRENDMKQVVLAEGSERMKKRDTRIEVGSKRQAIFDIMKCLSSDCHKSLTTCIFVISIIFPSERNPIAIFVSLLVILHQYCLAHCIGWIVIETQSLIS